MLDDFNQENGATRIVPNSHKQKKYPKNGKVYKDEKKIFGKKGSLLIFNPSMWHGGGANYSTKGRWGVVLGYYRWFKKPSFDFMQNTPKKFIIK